MEWCGNKFCLIVFYSILEKTIELWIIGRASESAREVKFVTSLKANESHSQQIIDTVKSKNLKYLVERKVLVCRILIYFETVRHFLPIKYLNFFFFYSDVYINSIICIMWT